MYKEKILELRKLGFSYKKIKEELGCARSTISYHCKYNNMNTPLPFPNKLSDDIIELIKTEYKTKTAKEIALNLNISKSVVQKYGSTHQRVKRIITNEIKEPHFCLNCGKLVKKKFCSRKCQHEYRQNEITKKIESGDITLDSRWYKKYLIIKYGEKCMKCGWNKRHSITHKVPIELEHKDGNSENHNLNNLELLCPNCHSLTLTYKGLNVGNGRYKRRERYRNHQSF
jgi:DNA-binding CsgD family transcriptional regulator